MKTATIVGVLLILLGAAGPAYQGITYATHEKILDIGPITATTEKTTPLPPVLGGVALVGGLALLVLGARRPLGCPKGEGRS
jgi:hypothetical protein